MANQTRPLPGSLIERDEPRPPCGRRPSLPTQPAANELLTLAPSKLLHIPAEAAVLTTPWVGDYWFAAAER